MDPCMGALPDTPASASPRNGQEQEKVEKTGEKNAAAEAKIIIGIIILLKKRNPYTR